MVFIDLNYIRKKEKKIIILKYVIWNIKKILYLKIIRI